MPRDCTALPSLPPTAGFEDEQSVICDDGSNTITHVFKTHITYIYTLI